ncbi:MAG: hypothetical protein U0893_20595 [Chloroflexota bacterium]
MRRALCFGVAIGVVVALAGLGLAHAEPANAPYCYNSSAPTYDMAGVYLAPELPARIEVNACGGAEVIWDNASGRHDAHYMAVERLPGGGFIAVADVAVGGVFPNGARVIGIKPAERGAIQLFTADGNGTITGVYRLTKIG